MMIVIVIHSVLVFVFVKALDQPVLVRKRAGRARFDQGHLDGKARYVVHATELLEVLNLHVRCLLGHKLVPILLGEGDGLLAVDWIGCQFFLRAQPLLTLLRICHILVRLVFAQNSVVLVDEILRWAFGDLLGHRYFRVG